MREVNGEVKVVVSRRLLLLGHPCCVEGEKTREGLFWGYARVAGRHCHEEGVVLPQCRSGKQARVRVKPPQPGRPARAAAAAHKVGPGGQDERGIRSSTW